MGLVIATAKLANLAVFVFSADAAARAISMAPTATKASNVKALVDAAANALKLVEMLQAQQTAGR